MSLATVAVAFVQAAAGQDSLWLGVLGKTLEVVFSGGAGWAVKLAVDTFDERRALFNSDRLTSIAGGWVGGGQDEITTSNDTSLEFVLNLTFVVKGKNITGNGFLRPKAETPGVPGYLMEFRGGFYTDDYLYLTYRNANQRYRHLGVIVLHQLASGDLSGNYAGLSIARNRFVTGSVSLEKIS